MEEHLDITYTKCLWVKHGKITEALVKTRLSVLYFGTICHHLRIFIYKNQVVKLILLHLDVTVGLIIEWINEFLKYIYNNNNTHQDIKNTKNCIISAPLSWW